MNKKIVLGIETSCDDTSICLLEEHESRPRILAHVSFTQEEILKKWGGIVPEIAARNHLQKIAPLLEEAFIKSKLSIHDIDLIGVTTTPGLLGPLLTGLNAAKTISLIAKKPILPVNHLYAHLEAIHLTEDVSYPYLGLLVSGGHSAFFWVKSKDEFEVIASTIDDAAGEAFDKGGKLLGLGYPAGKIIDQVSKFGNKEAHEFPIGLISSKDARMSFSGLKTALRIKIEKESEYAIPHQFVEKEENFQAFYDICASYQEAIVRALVFKTKYARSLIQEKYKLKNYPLVIGGGVACNSRIRESFIEKYKEVYFVKPQFCTDNGAMIANFALRNFDKAIQNPDCLELDSRGRFIDKKDFN
jgi:N6-L-threonylcarbamoyladenine synthase